MLIAIDLDEVLADWVGTLTKFHNKKYGSRLKREDFSSYRFADVWGGSRAESLKKVRDFIASPYFSGIKPVKGSIEGVDKLSRIHDLVIVTSRWESLKAQTEDWVNRHFPGKFSGIYFSSNKYSLKPGNSKGDICRRIHADVLVEDDLIYAREAVEKGIRVILFDTPWNRSKDFPGIKRVYFWKDIVKEIRKME